jgi:hypothetical protein
MTFIPVINVTTVCYQGMYLYPLKIIHVDHTYQYASMSIAEVVTSVSDQYNNFLIAAVHN